MSNQDPVATIYVVSDGRGETCTQVVRAALVQFEGRPHRIVRWAEVRTSEAVLDILKQAGHDRAVVFFTLVGEATRRTMLENARRLLIPTVDVLGPPFSALHDHFHQDPGTEPGLLYASDREAFDRQAAIDYTLRHDDGRNAHDLDRADVVLVGVSRSSKSSTCFYLAYGGIRAANVPLIPGVDPPSELVRLDPARVIGLRINVTRLRTVREARLRDLSSSTAGGNAYLDQRAVAREVLEANLFMDRQGWRGLDVSYMAVEEIAREVRRARGL